MQNVQAELMRRQDESHKQLQQLVAEGRMMPQMAAIKMQEVKQARLSYLAPGTSDCGSACVAPRS